MTEHSDKIKQILAELHAELELSDTLDGDARDQLASMFHEIGDFLSSESDADAPPSADLTNRIESAANDFQASHPVLANLLERTAQALASIGI